jgi:DNA repair exonuclease SbcCD ATPase subunit
MKRKCPLCNIGIVDILEHIRISHDIDSVEEFNNKITEREKRNVEQQEFQKYIQELQEMEKKGTISAEEYRQRVTEWIKQHKT